MNTMSCDTVRDLYPDLVNEKLDATTAVRVRSHISSCDECSAEIAILDSIRRPIEVPIAFENRVVQATRKRPRIGRGELAMAATLAFALIGGSAIVQMQSRAIVPVSAPAHVGVVGVEDAMLTGTRSLDDLSIEELQKLLGEMES